MGKRMFSLLLALLLTGSVMVSCGGETDTTIDNETPEAAGETAVSDPYEAYDFGGKTLRISSSVNEYDSTNAHRLIAGTGETNGEIVNDAVFQRNEEVMALLNVKLDFIETDWTYDTCFPELESLVMSGDCGFEVVINDLRGLTTCARSGYLYSIANNPVMDFTKSYWYKEAMEDLELVEGARFLLIGDLFMDVLASSHVLYYNKDIINDAMGSPDAVQDIVLEDGWTADKMIEIMELTAQDTDGDGTMKEGDLMGYALTGPWGPLMPVLIAMDVDTIDTSGGKPVYCFNNERSVKVLDTINRLYWNKNTLGQPSDFTSQGVLNLFMNRQAVFAGYQRLGDLEKMRDAEFRIGIAPYPKLDDAQENYVSSMHNTSEVGGIVVTTPAGELEFISVCLEVMCREAQKTILPVYYEEALKVKYVGGTDDAAMIDLIHNTITSPRTLAYDKNLNNFLMGTCFLFLVRDQKNDFASAYASAIDAATADLNALVEDFAKVVENAG